MMPNLLVIIEKNHPLYSECKKHFETKPLDEALASFETYDLIIDLTVLRTKKKAKLIKELVRTTKSQIISDLSLCWGEYIFRTHPQIAGALSLLFYSPTNCAEYAINSHTSYEHEQTREIIEHFLKILGKEGVQHKDLKLGFHFPRTLAMVINEAYFSLEESLATPEAIDLAMKNGVNYPLGPVEWGQKTGLHHICDLLQELYEITEDPRYRISKELKLQSQIQGTL